MCEKYYQTQQEKIVREQRISNKLSPSQFRKQKDSDFFSVAHTRDSTKVLIKNYNGTKHREVETNKMPKTFVSSKIIYSLKTTAFKLEIVSLIASSLSHTAVLLQKVYEVFLTVLFLL